MRAIFWLAALVAACAPISERVPLRGIDPDATFVAHRVHGGLAIDRFGDRAQGDVRSVGRFGSSGPTFLLETDGTMLAALWLTAPATVTVRTTGTPSAPSTMAVRPSWEDQAIRLTVDAADGRSYRTGPFARADAAAGIPALSRNIQTNLDPRGTFRADVIDATGATVGWVQVRVPGPDAPRVFQALLPPAPSAMGPALAVALDSEVDWIEDHAVDVYRGPSGGRGVGAVPGR